MESSLVTFLPIGLAGFEKADYSIGEVDREGVGVGVDTNKDFYSSFTLRPLRDHFNRKKYASTLPSTPPRQRW